MKMDWNERDLEALAEREISVEEAERQLALLREPPKSLELVRPATPGDGIRVVPDSEIRGLIERADEAARKRRLMKFVPASGAATRMFRDLTPALDPERSLNGAPNRFFRAMAEFPFASELETLAERHGVSLAEDLSDDGKRTILKLLLTDEGLGYAQLPKGLITFHRYENGFRTAFEEQLREGIRFGSNGQSARFHFTVSQTDLGGFSTESKRLIETIREETGVTASIEFSVQHPATDTIATTPEGEPFREENGSLLFRPGGHGALLRNLDEIDGDVVFIKNIDNVRPEHAQEEIAHWYRILIGYLANLEDRVRHAVRSLDQDDPTAITRASAFSSETFGRPWRGDRDDHQAMKSHVVDALSRPIRVCAVVKNEGEPGGAPFWVRDGEGHESIQIVESSQIDMSDSRQQKIFGSSTHFNPVAIACSLRSVEGATFDLKRFVDPSAAIVARKTHQGRELLALEHPGLWNGSMAGWNTICVDTPASTFAPVKSVFDLLRDEHQTYGRRD